MDSAPDTPNSADEQDSLKDSPSLERASAWLAATRASAILALLRIPEHAHISMTAFAGFRVNSSGYDNPIVRRRLAQEIVQNHEFASKVRELADSQPELIAPQPAVKPATKRKEKPQNTRDFDSRDPGAKAEREHLRRERDEAREALRTIATSLKQAQQDCARLDQAQNAQATLVERQQHQISRLERQATIRNVEQTALLKRLHQYQAAAGDAKLASATPAPSKTISRGRTQNKGSDSLWPEAVRHLQQKGKHEIALILASDVLRAAPEDLVALKITAESLEQTQMNPQAAGVLARMLNVQLKRGLIPDSSDTLMRLVRLQPDPKESVRAVGKWLSYLRPQNESGIESARTALDRLRSQSPDLHLRLTDQIRRGSPVLAPLLISAERTLGPDDVLPLPYAPTARRVILAVNANETAFVGCMRDALAAAENSGASRIWDALAHAAGDDDSVLAPLRRAPRGPVVIDGSNAAWFDQGSYVHPQARLRSLLELRRLLRHRGYFPVLLYADAPLPYTIDDASGLEQMIVHHEIELVDSGIDADEVLLREAKHHNAPLITNDHMTDWDPNNEVVKIQFTVSPNGEAHLLL